MTQMQMTLENNKVSLFSNKNFLILWLGQLVSHLGDSFFSFATTIWMISTLGLENLAILMAITAVPRIILGPIAGTVVDRVSRKTIIWLSDILRGFLMLFAAWIINSGEFNTFYFYLIFISTNIISTFFGPAISATLPNIIQKDQLSQANSIRQGTDSFTQILGPAIAGLVLLAFRGTGKAIPLLVLFNGISFLLSGISELFLDVPQNHINIAATGVSVLKSFGLQLKDGVKYVWNSEMLLKMMLVFAIMNFFLVPIFQLIVPGILVDGLNAENWLGFIQSGIAVGFIISSVLLSIIKDKKHYKLLFVGLVSLGVGILLLGIVSAFGLLSFLPINHTLISLIFVSAIIGMSAAAANIKLSTIMQYIVPDEVRGRVFALLNTLASGLMPLSLALTGLIALKIPLYIIPLFAGFMVVMASLIFSKIKGIKNY